MASANSSFRNTIDKTISTSSRSATSCASPSAPSTRAPAGMPAGARVLGADGEAQEVAERDEVEMVLSIVFLNDEFADAIARRTKIDDLAAHFFPCFRSPDDDQ